MLEKGGVLELDIYHTFNELIFLLVVNPTLLSPHCAI